MFVSEITIYCWTQSEKHLQIVTVVSGSGFQPVSYHSEVTDSLWFADS